jgi:hypothetical protein
MAEEPKIVMLNGGRDVSVALVAGADAFLLQLLGGTRSKTGAATLKVVKNAAGVPFVAVIIANKHVGFLSHADAGGLLPVLAEYESQGTVAAAKAVLAAAPDGTGTPALRLSLAPPDRLLTAPMPAATPTIATPPETKSLPGLPCPSCGTLLPADARFCLACGTPATVTAAPQQSAAAPVQPGPLPRLPATPASLTTSPMSSPLGQAPRPTHSAKTLPNNRGWRARQSSRNKLLLVAGAVVVLLIVIIASVMSGGGGGSGKDLAGVARGDDLSASATLGLAGPVATVINSSPMTLSETSVAPMGAVTEPTQTERSSSAEAKASLTTAGGTSATTAAQATTTTTVEATTSTTMATTTTVAPAVGDEDITVYRTDTGKKYHRAECPHLAKSKHAITLAEAKALGLGPCGTCHPPE